MVVIHSVGIDRARSHRVLGGPQPDHGMGVVRGSGSSLALARISRKVRRWAKNTNGIGIRGSSGDIVKWKTIIDSMGEE